MRQSLVTSVRDSVQARSQLASKAPRQASEPPFKPFQTARPVIRPKNSNSKTIYLNEKVLERINQKLRKQDFKKSLRERDVISAEIQITEALSGLQDVSPVQQGGSAAFNRDQATLQTANVFQGYVQGFFRLCLQQGKLAAALSLAQKLPPDPPLFTFLLKACLDYGDLYAVTQAVEVRREAGIPEDAFCYTALLKAAAREQNAVKTEALFDRAWHSGIRTAPIFNVLIGQHNELGQVKEAFATYARMLGLGVEPDEVTMNLLIKAAGLEGRLDKVEELYNQMKRIGPQPTSITFVHLFAAFQNSRRKEPVWLLQVYEDMVGLRIQPITQHLVTFLGACCDAPLSAREIQQVFARAMAFCAASGGDCSVYAALLKFCVSQGIPEKAVDVWKAITKAKHQLNSWVYSAMFTACAAYKSAEHCMILTQAYHSLQNHFKEVKAAGDLSPSELRGQRIAFNALLNACAKTGMMTAAEELLDSMQKHGPDPDIISYNTLISGHAQAANTNGAFDVFYELCEASSHATTTAFRLRPNGHTFGSMLHSCARAGNADSAKRVLELMRHAALQPTAEAYTSLMHACIKQGSPENVNYAFQILDRMKAEGVRPSAVTYGCLMNGCETTGTPDQAIKLYKEACAQGIFPSDECHNTLINVFSQRDRLEEALESVQVLAKKKGRYFQAAALNSLIRALAPEYVQKAIHMLGVLRKEGLRIQRDTYVALIQACTQEFLIDIAQELYWTMSNEGAVASQEAGSRLIMALCRANEVEGALALYNDMVLASRPEPTHDLDSNLHSAMPSIASSADQQWVSDTAACKIELESRTGNSLGAMGAALDHGPQTVHKISDSDSTLKAPFELTMADRLGLRRGISYEDDYSAVMASEEYHPAKSRKSRRYKHAVFPHSRAIAALVQAFANQDLEKAFDLYCQLRQDSMGAAAVTLSDRFMWQSLIEAACRKSRLSMALQVYDDWKAYCAMQESLHRFDRDAYAHVPKLSNVTLAFLEACCRAEASRATGTKAEKYSLRVYDVCATMRQQQERKVQATLPRPRKASHHFAENAAEQGLPIRDCTPDKPQN